MRGVFISFEGIDGCGKTTQLAMLEASLRDAGIEPILAREPGGTRVGQLIRGILLDSANADIAPRAELLLYFASRAQNVDAVIRPALEAGRVVLCDRFTDATVAYQGYGRGLGADLVLRLDKVACDGLRPDLTLWLDLDAETARSRARSRNDGLDADENRMEALSLSFFSRVRSGYAELHATEPARVQRVDASGPPLAVAGRVLRLVRQALKGRGLAPRPTSCRPRS